MTALLPPPVVSIDGPNGVGKTAVARSLAQSLGWRWLSVGMVYRALAAAGASPESALRLRTCRAADGVSDPAVEIDGSTVTERELLGEELARRAAAIAHDPIWQRKVNIELRRYASGGLVAEGRATGEIFPDAILNLFLWADPAERSRRAAAVTGSPHSADRDRGDADRPSEPLRVRPGAVVWDSTRYAMDATVADLHRRVRLAAGAEPAVVAVTSGRAAGSEREGQLRLVDAATAAEPVDAVLCIPPGRPGRDLHQLARAHLRLLMAGNDLISVGGTWTGAVPTATQRMLEVTPWPVSRWLRAGWLPRHGHFAVSAEVLSLAAATPADLAALAAGSEPSAALLEALQGSRWIPNRGAVLRAPAAAGIRPAHRDLDTLLSSLQEPGAADPDTIDLRACTDVRAPLWVLAAAPHRVLEATLSWAGPVPEGTR